MPSTWTVRVLCDRGLQSPRLWAAIGRQGWHPYLRYDRPMTLPATTGRRQAAPWVVLTEEPPAAVDLGAYGLRVWIEQGFRVLQRIGWPWHRTRRVDRHGRVLAVTTLWVIAYGTRVEEALLRDRAPGQLRQLPLRVFQLGLFQAQRLRHRGYAWQRVWLQPTP